MDRTYTDEQLEEMKAKPFEFEGQKYDTYTATQKQRQMERTARKLKRRRDAYKAAGLENDANLSNIRLQRLNERYAEFSDAAGLPKQEERIKTYSLPDEEVLIRKRPMPNYKVGENKFNIDKAKEDYIEFLKTAPERSKVLLKWIFDTTQYVEDTQIKTPFGYDPAKDIILYNPLDESFWGYDFWAVNTHELAHRLDNIMLIDSAKNEVFRKAIENSRAKIEADPEKYIDYSFFYDDDGFISDIFSAICGGKYTFWAGHGENYWKKSGNKQKDVFANLCGLEAYNDTAKISFLKKEFPEIWEIYDKEAQIVYEEILRRS